MLSEYHILKAIRDDLIEFSLPTNCQGFFIDYCEWVIKEWGHRFCHPSDSTNFGQDFANFPQQANLMLKDQARNYRDFIHASYGHHYAASLSPDGSSSQTMEKRLYEFFHESMRLRALAFMEGHYPHVEGEDFWNRIFCEDFEGEEERITAEDITELFGFYGIAAAPYTCPAQPSSNEGRFASWFLADFMTSAGLIRAFGKDSLGMVARAAGRLFVLRNGGLSAPSVKKPLSHNGVIA